MVSIDFSEGISETLDILEHMDRTYTNKIPKKFKDFLEKNKSVTYVSKLDYSKKLSEMRLKEKTKDILAIIYINYWCNLEQKNNYISLLNENEKKYQEAIREKYNPNYIFKKSIQENNLKENSVKNEPAMVEVKESIFKKIINKIKRAFNR